MTMLDAYDAQLRGISGFGQGSVDSDGPLWRLSGGPRGFVTAPRDLGLPDAEVDALIERTIAHYRSAGVPFEWKTRGHDLPADLPQRLRRAGFVAEPAETVMIGDAAQMPAPVPVPGIATRTTTAGADLERIAGLHAAVWGGERGWLAAELAGRIAADPAGITIFLAEDQATAEVVCAAWLELAGEDFAGLWGGSTLAGYRHRGIYRNLVAQRAQLARELGRRYLQVDASSNSAPILARLGLVAVTTTTPYIWTPPTR